MEIPSYVEIVSDIRICKITVNNIDEL